MNKKIYFNDKFLLFTDDPGQASQNQSFRFYKEVTDKQLAEITEHLLSENTVLSGEKTDDIGTLPANFEQVLDFFKKNFYFIEAAGGLIRKKDEFLFIYRLGKWDLPKGKLNKKETPEAAAVRECEEECAIRKLRIEEQLPSTYHIYKYKDKYALKKTYWYYMSTDYDKKLSPQTEENIEEVKWFKKEAIEKVVFSNTYPAIKDLVMHSLPQLPG